MSLENERLIMSVVIIALGLILAHRFMRERSSARLRAIEATFEGYKRDCEEKIDSLVKEQAKLVSLVGTQSQIITDLITIIAKSDQSATTELHKLMSRVIDNMRDSGVTLTSQGTMTVGQDVVGRDRR